MIEADDYPGLALERTLARSLGCTRRSGRREAPIVDDATRIEAARLIARKLLHDYMRLRTQLAARPGDREWSHRMDDAGAGSVVSQVLSI